MIGPFFLLGHADSVGRRLGFLLPLFRRAGSNQTFVQRVADDRILGFEPVEIHTPVHHDGGIGMEANEGEEPILSFGLGDSDILVERLAPLRLTLAERLDDLDRGRHTFLALEAADFVGDTKRRLAVAKSAFQFVRDRSREAALRWRDASILTPDLRKALAEETGRPLSDFGGVVARSDEMRVAIFGLPEEFALSNELHSTSLRRAIRPMAPLYEDLSGDLRVVIEGKRRAPAKGKTPKADALIWLVDASLAVIRSSLEDDFAWRVDAFAATDFERFAMVAEETGAPAYAVVRRDRDLSLQQLDRTLPPYVATIEWGNPRSGDRDRSGLSGSRTRIAVPTSGFNGASTPTKSMARTIRQIVAMTNGGAGRTQDRPEWVFLKARGMGSAPALDACAAVYDRLASMGVWPVDAIAAVSGRDARDGASLDVFFGETQVLDDFRTMAEMRRSASDIAMLAARRGSDDRRGRHGLVVKAVLEKGGWHPTYVPHGELPTFEVRSESIAEVAASANAAGYRGTWDLPGLLRKRLDDVHSVSIEADASPAVVLSRLFVGDTLVANMRDLCAADPAGGVWSLLAAQVRRHGGGLASKGRTHFLAVLINHALLSKDVELSEIDALAKAIRAPELGSTLWFAWSRARMQRGGETTAEVRLYRRAPSSGSFSGSEVLRFRLVIHGRGTAIRASSDAGA